MSISLLTFIFLSFVVEFLLLMIKQLFNFNPFSYLSQKKKIKLPAFTHRIFRICFLNLLIHFFSQRMPNPMGGMGGPKPCMMGGPHMGPRMMPGPNMNAMNGKI